MRRPGIKRFHDRIADADLEGVRSLLADGAPLTRHHHGFTALHLAVFEGATGPHEKRPILFAIAEALLDAGADIDAATPEPKTTALQLALPDDEWVGWLLDRGANPDRFDSSAIDNNTAPPLVIAIVKGAIAPLRRLLAAGANTDFVCETTLGTADGPLVIALKFDQKEAFDVLLDEVTNAPSQVNDALAQALLRSNHDAISRLLRAGARGDAGNARRWGRPIVEMAYLRRDLGAIALLRPHTAPEVMAAFDDWVADRRGILGVIGHTPEEEASLRVTGNLPPAAIVKNVASESAAERIGLRSGDLIVAVADRDVQSFVELRAALSGLSAGQAVLLNVIRSGEPRLVTVVLKSPSGWD